MTTETVLTDEGIRSSKYILGVIAPDEFFNKIARAIEQAVLQSPEVQRLREALGWQPIETAPKDGARVILAWGGESINGFFLDNSQSLRPWAGRRTESMVPIPSGQPTHWMPLPPPPQHDNQPNEEQT